MQQQFFHGNGKIVECVCSVGVIKDVFGHGSFFVITVVDSKIVD
jgi:hypothetical protein